MKNSSGTIIFAAVLAAISLYYLSFTYVGYKIRKDAQTFATNSEGKVDFEKKQQYFDSLWQEKVYLGLTFQELTEREIGLGLDLQGGMHVVLEVDASSIVKGMAGGNARSAQFQQALKLAQAKAQSSQSDFVDIFATEYKRLVPNKTLASVFSNSANRGRIASNASDGQVASILKEEVNGAVTRAYEILQTRVDKFGVANPNIQRLPASNLIQVELPGIDNPERVRKLLSGAAKLEFTEVYIPSEITPALEQLGNFLKEEEKTKASAPLKTTSKTDSAETTEGKSLAEQLAAKSDSAGADSANINNTGLAGLFVPMQQGLGVYLKDTARANEILSRPEVRSMFPADLFFAWDRKEIQSADERSILALYLLKKPNGQAPLEGDVIVDATNDFDQFGKPEVSMRMNGAGARKWRTLTGANIGRPIAIILDGLVYTAPNVNGEIPNGNSSISGNFTIDETKDLANVLKAGKLPAPTHIVEEAVVGSTLGSEAVRDGLLSSLVGFLCILVFVVAYYGRAGWIADLTLVINLFFLMGVMASLGAVLTLPGIAGIVLSIGMAVDANVLIFEGIKAEMQEGKPFKIAVASGFKASLSAIIDSNLTTLFTGAILFIFGTGLVLGFATTLVIGVIISLFTAIFLTKLFLDFYVARNSKLEFASGITKNWFKNTSFDFVSQRRKFYLVAGLILVVGVASFIFKGFSLGIDFKGGRSYTVRFEKNVSTDDIRAALDKSLGEGPSLEVKTFGGLDQVRVTTDYLIEDTSPEADAQAASKIQEAASGIAGNPGKIESSAKVGPTIASDMITNAIWAILLALVINFIYIFIRFKNLAFSYGTLVSLVHDVFVMLAIFSLFNGWLPFSLDIDQAFVGAMLTIMGYSLNDTVVIFDRIRDYLKDPRSKNESIPTIINNALNKTLSRTAVTGVTTIMVLVVLMIFGGVVLRGFSFAMLIGVIVGTYSSLFVAAPIVVDSLLRQKKNKEEALEVLHEHKGKRGETVKI